MENPIPSAMIYFDEKQKRAVLCLDKGIPPNLVESCNKNGAFHTHSWVPFGWVSEAAFMHGVAPRELAARFVKDLMKSIVSIRDDFDRMEHEREVTIKMNQMLRKSVRELLLGLDKTICHIESEEKRLEVAKLIGKHAQHTLTADEIEGEAS